MRPRASGSMGRATRASMASIANVATRLEPPKARSGMPPRAASASNGCSKIAMAANRAQPRTVSVFDPRNTITAVFNTTAANAPRHASPTSSSIA